MRTIKNLLKVLKIGDVTRYRNMSVFPLKVEEYPKVDYITLDEALKQKLIEITEISESGSVPKIRVNNKSDKKVLIMDGEQLVGAKQNRVANTNILVKEKSEIVIPVSCVEQGRWHSTSRGFSPSRYHSYCRLRKNLSRGVSMSLSTNCDFASDQGMVWRDIRNKIARHRVQSRTSAMGDVYRNMEKELNKYLEHFRCVEGQNGFIVSVNGKIAGMEFFNDHNVLKKNWDKLIVSYAMDALDNIESDFTQTSMRKIEDFISEIEESDLESYSGVGLGKDVRIKSNKLAGSALVFDKVVLHMSVFVNEPENKEPRKPNFISRITNLRQRRKFAG